MTYSTYVHTFHPATTGLLSRTPIIASATSGSLPLDPAFVTCCIFSSNLGAHFWELLTVPGILA